MTWFLHLELILFVPDATTLKTKTFDGRKWAVGGGGAFDEEIHSKNMSVFYFRKPLQNRLKYERRIRDLKGVAAKTTVHIIQ